MTPTRPRPLWQAVPPPPITLWSMPTQAGSSNGQDVWRRYEDGGMEGEGRARDGGRAGLRPAQSTLRARVAIPAKRERGGGRGGVRAPRSRRRRRPRRLGPHRNGGAARGGRRARRAPPLGWWCHPGGRRPQRQLEGRPRAAAAAGVSADASAATRPGSDAAAGGRPDDGRALRWPGGGVTTGTGRAVGGCGRWGGGMKVGGGGGRGDHRVGDGKFGWSAVLGHTRGNSRAAVVRGRAPRPPTRHHHQQKMVENY